MLLGVDTGGTFTDFVLIDDARCLRVHKVLSTPDAPERAILQGIHDLGIGLDDLLVVHGSTVATNAALEGKGVATAYITNTGLGDVLTIGRQARASLYDLQPGLDTPPVTASMCVEVDTRRSAEGVLLRPLTDDMLKDLVERIKQLAPQAVAINLLFSYLDDEQERRIEAVIPDGVFVSRSSTVLAEYREYERGIATWLNAYVGPLMQGYLNRLEASLGSARLTVMQSSGETISAPQAAKKAVNLLLSGPAGGLMGARAIGKDVACDRLLSFDMGGTSTDVALIDGDVCLTQEGRIGPYPVVVPMVDMHTIGAGGGSIAVVDEGGMLQVGPASAGADPGPACYGKGGSCATVTDANLVLGRLRAEDFLGGKMVLDVSAARRVIQAIADQLSLSLLEAAEGVIRLVNENMAAALRVISVQRGIDPADFVLTSFGGAGGLHVCALAELVGVHQALVPVNAGVLSAFGMLVAPRGRQLSHTLTGMLDDFDGNQLEQEFQRMIDRGCDELVAEGVARADIHSSCSLDLRYRGQSSSLNLPWEDIVEAQVAFHARHEARFGHRLTTGVELVNLRVVLRASETDVDFNYQQPPIDASIHSERKMMSVYPRAGLIPAQLVSGPALITEQVATTYIAAGWQARVGDKGHLLLTMVRATS
ncbi:MAG: hydantoinase/oxoprolinase family protein [Gammaproteobacteria bacterium]|nr:hydantoinase/oxoprolinase family protein [Gammaproteobacteria bacterium]